MRKKHLLFSLVAILFLLLPHSIYAQGVTTAEISGLVLDENGSPLPGANVIAYHEPSGTQYGVSTRTDGRFNLPNIRIGGPYTVTVSFLGYTKQKQENIYLSLGQNLRLDFNLTPESFELGEVVVSAVTDPVLNGDRTGAATNVGVAQLEELPTISRGIEDFTRLDPRASGFSFGGRNNLYNNFSLDGSIFNNPFGLDSPVPGGQTNAQPVSLDAIEQVQVSIAPFDVRQGSFTGAGINSVTKSGTNEFSGSVYSYIRNENFIGDKVRGVKVRNSKLKYNQSGFRLGGPIIKNTLFFFINGEIERREDPGSDFVAKRPGLSGPDVSRVLASDLDRISQRLKDVYGYDTGPYENYINHTKNNKILAKLDWNITQEHSLSLRYNYLKAERELPPHPFAINFTGGRGPNANTLPFRNTGYAIHNNINSIVAELNSRFGNKYSK